MIHIRDYKLFESKEAMYNVFIEWEHGDADKNTLEIYPFKNENVMKEFIYFIFDLRVFTKSYSAYNKTHYYHFKDGHYQREKKWIDEVDAKYGNKFSNLIPNDNKYNNNEYKPGVNSIWVRINGLDLNIIWEKAINKVIIDLPKIGDKIITNTGHISGYGPSLWNKSNDNFYNYNDIKNWDVGDIDDKYFEIEVEVTDCRINSHLTYDREEYDYKDNKEILIDSYTTFRDITQFDYVLLCRLMDKYITINMKGFDTHFANKYGYALYGTNDFYLIK